jgi:hypothetical protein
MALLGAQGSLLRWSARETRKHATVNITSLAAVARIDNCDGDRHLNVEAGGQEHTQWLAPVSRAASPYPFPCNRAKSCHYCNGVRRCSMMKLAPLRYGESLGRL